MSSNFSRFLLLNGLLLNSIMVASTMLPFFSNKDFSSKLFRIVENSLSLSPFSIKRSLNLHMVVKSGTVVLNPMPTNF